MLLSFINLKRINDNIRVIGGEKGMKKLNVFTQRGYKVLGISVTLFFLVGMWMAK
jgi:hypothetical protein